MVNKLKFKKSNLSEVCLLAPRLRADDKKEVMLAGSDPVTSLENGIKYSTECISVYSPKYQIIGMFGYMVQPNKTAVVWFLGSDEIEKYPFTFVREGKKFINNLTELGLTLVNYVYSENETHIKYLLALGFTIEFDKPIFVNTAKFYPFYKLGD